MINHTVKKEKALKSNKVRFSDICHKRTITMNLKTLKLTYTWGHHFYLGIVSAIWNIVWLGRTKLKKRDKNFHFSSNQSTKQIHVTDKTNKQTKNQIFHYCSNAEFPRYQKHKCVKNATQKVLSPITFIFFSCNIVSPSKEKSECTELLG